MKEKKVSKYDDLIKEFIREKIEDPSLPISKFCETRGLVTTTLTGS